MKIYCYVLFCVLFCAFVLAFSVTSKAQYIDTCLVNGSRTYTAIGGLDNSTYEWQINGVLQTENGIDCFCTWYKAGVYDMAVTETTTNGCIGKTYTYLVLVSDEIENYEIQIPNIFTPNNDGQNDLFSVKARNVDSYQIEIFNRWGEKLYQSTDISASWDGTYNGVLSAAGVYFYNIEYKRNNETKKINGFFQLFR